MSVHSVHHITGVTAQIGRNMEFYTGVLGLRLVKRSVNQDDVSAYHLFYADALGSPGTDITFFDWPTSAASLPGPTTVALTSFRIPGDSLEWWEARLEAARANPEMEPNELGQSRILFTDPEGQRLELCDDTGLAGSSTPWSESVPEEKAIRGLMGVDLDSARPDATRLVLTEFLGYREIKGAFHLYETDDDRHYSMVRVKSPEGRRIGRVGAGGIHHVAFRVEDDQELDDLRMKIEKAGLKTSGFVDRFYFHSVYFREPGGVLFELATDGPGFESDESHDSLGKKLALPPFLEARRIEIEAGLKPLPF